MDGKICQRKSENKNDEDDLEIQKYPCKLTATDK